LKERGKFVAFEGGDASGKSTQDFLMNFPVSASATPHFQIMDFKNFGP